MELTMKDLKQCFKDAKRTKALFIGVKISTRGSAGAEVIINPSENFAAKLKYYKENYTDDLVLKKYDGIQIIDCAFGDCFDQIECAFEEEGGL